ncbi:MAG: amidohydrolase family protein, partial [Pseudomonadales bacterium]|nr:amidohydrolase family protein [Pseudomonadales bacterium]
LMQEVRQAFLSQRLNYRSASFSHDDALQLATAGGANLFHRPDIGQIAPGLQADLALFDLNELRFSGAGDPIAALVLCGAHRANAVMVQGDWRVRDGQLVDMDINEVMASQRKAAKALTR